MSDGYLIEINQAGEGQVLTFTEPSGYEYRIELSAYPVIWVREHALLNWERLGDIFVSEREAFALDEQEIEDLRALDQAIYDWEVNSGVSITRTAILNIIWNELKWRPEGAWVYDRDEELAQLIEENAALKQELKKKNKSPSGGIGISPVIGSSSTPASGASMTAWNTSPAKIITPEVINAVKWMTS